MITMLELYTREAAAATRAEQDLYQRQYELYGLTEAEIRVVENGG